MRLTTRGKVIAAFVAGVLFGLLLANVQAGYDACIAAGHSQAVCGR